MAQEEDTFYAFGENEESAEEDLEEGYDHAVETETAEEEIAQKDIEEREEDEEEVAEENADQESEEGEEVEGEGGTEGGEGEGEKEKSEGEEEEDEGEEGTGEEEDGREEKSESKEGGGSEEEDEDKEGSGGEEESEGEDERRKSERKDTKSKKDDGKNKERGKGELTEQESIAADIVSAMVDEAMVGHSRTSLDSLVLQELKESEDTAQHVAETMAQRKKEIQELRNKPELTEEDVRTMESKQAEIQEMVEGLQRLTEKIKELLEGPFRPSTFIPPAGPDICPICHQVECICETTTAEKGPYLAGNFYQYQVDPYPLKRKDAKICICGMAYDECICRSSKSDEECACKREDLAKFNIIADVMPKVVVCAPDVRLPRIIVCEPYTPKKIKRRRKCY